MLNKFNYELGKTQKTILNFNFNIIARIFLYHGLNVAEGLSGWYWDPNQWAVKKSYFAHSLIFLINYYRKIFFNFYKL